MLQLVVLAKSLALTLEVHLLCMYVRLSVYAFACVTACVNASYRSYNHKQYAD